VARARRCAGRLGARKIGAACNAFAEKAMERSAEARSAEALRKGEARKAEPTCHSVHAEALRAEGRGPKGRGEILGVVNVWDNGSELDSCSAQVIMRKGVSKGTSTSRCRPLSVSQTSRHKTVLPPCTLPIRCIIAEKPQKMAHFSKTGSRNMAETCAINFSYPTLYSTSIVIGGLSALLLPFLM